MTVLIIMLCTCKATVWDQWKLVRFVLLYLLIMMVVHKVVFRSFQAMPSRCYI